MSGYTPDYLGQLIRKGKLSGKQIYLNVAWVTTETALKEYMAKQGASAKDAGFMQRTRAAVRTWLVAHTSIPALIRLARNIIYLFIALVVLFIVFLFYAFGANVSRSLNQKPYDHAGSL